MAIYIVIASILLGCMLIMAWSSLENNARQQDSALKQRAIFNINVSIAVINDVFKISLCTIHKVVELTIGKAHYELLYIFNA